MQTRSSWPERHAALGLGTEHSPWLTEQHTGGLQNELSFLHEALHTLTTLINLYKNCDNPKTWWSSRAGHNFLSSSQMAILRSGRDTHSTPASSEYATPHSSPALTLSNPTTPQPSRLGTTTPHHPPLGAAAAAAGQAAAQQNLPDQMALDPSPSDSLEGRLLTALQSAEMERAHAEMRAAELQG